MRGGLAARFGALPVTAALPMLVLPLAAVLLAVLTAGLRDAVGLGRVPSVGWFWSLLYGAALVAAVGSALGRRALVAAGAAGWLASTPAVVVVALAPGPAAALLGAWRGGRGGPRRRPRARRHGAGDRLARHRRDPRGDG